MCAPDTRPNRPPACSPDSGGRKADRENGALGPFTLDPNIAPLILDDLVSYSKTEAGSFLLAGEKRIEDIVHLFSGDTRPGIRNRYFNHIFSIRGSHGIGIDCQKPTGRHCLDRIEYNIVHSPDEIGLIRKHFVPGLFIQAADLDITLINLRFQGFKNMVDNIVCFQGIDP